MTQNELAEKLFVSRDLVAKWEAGIRRPDYKTILRLAELFNIAADEIITPDEYIIEELSECIPENAETDIEQLKNILNAFLRSLNVKESSIFIRRYYHLEEPAEIADFFGTKAQNVYLVLSRVRKKLKKYLSEVLK